MLLLRPEANAAANGELRRFHPGATGPYLIFRYHVVRVWEEPLERFLGEGLGTLPLAVLTNEAKGDLTGVVKRIEERLKALSDPSRAAKLQACTLLLMGLRYTDTRIAEVRKEIEMVDLRESSFYKLVRKEIRDELQAELLAGVEQTGSLEEARQVVLSLGEQKGRLEEARRTILTQGGRKFGAPPAGLEATLEGVTDRAKLEALVDRLFDVSSWEALLAGV